MALIEVIFNRILFNLFILMKKNTISYNLHSFVSQLGQSYNYIHSYFRTFRSQRLFICFSRFKTKLRSIKFSILFSSWECNPIGALKKLKTTRIRIYLQVDRLILSTLLNFYNSILVTFFCRNSKRDMEKFSLRNEIILTAYCTN